MKMLLYVLSLGLVMSLSPCIGEKVAASPSVLVYSVYLENGTVINISNDAANFEEIDFQVMNYLNNISNRM
jgi:hypothetical protein